MTHNSGTTHLHRLIAGYDIPTQGVKAGDRGGWVENVNDEAWVYGEARVGGNVRVGGEI